MKKLLRSLFILLLLGLGFLYIVKNPDLPISEKILKTIGLERLFEIEAVTETGYIIDVPEAGLSFTYPFNLESMPKDPFTEYDGAESKVRNNTLYVGGISGQAMVKLIQKPYHIVDGIDDYSLTLEEKNAFLSNGTCPREGWVCTGKKIGDYDVLYAYGINMEGVFIDMHLFILASDSFIYVENNDLKAVAKMVRQEDYEIIKQKTTELGLDEEAAMHSTELYNFQISLFQEKLQNITGALLKTNQHAQTFIDSMQYMTGFTLTTPVITGSETTGDNEISENRNNIDVFFENCGEVIDVSFRSALIDQQLGFIVIPNHDSISVNPKGVIDIDGGYRFSITEQSEVCAILQTLNHSDLSCDDEVDGAQIYIEFKKTDATNFQLWIAHYLGMMKIDLIKKTYPISAK